MNRYLSRAARVAAAAERATGNLQRARLYGLASMWLYRAACAAAGRERQELLHEAELRAETCRFHWDLVLSEMRIEQLSERLARRFA